MTKDKDQEARFRQKTKVVNTKIVAEKLRKQLKKAEENKDTPKITYEQWIQDWDKNELFLYAKRKFIDYKEKNHEDEHAYWRVKKDVAEYLIPIFYKILIENDKKRDAESLFKQYNVILHNPENRLTQYISTSYAIERRKKNK